MILQTKSLFFITFVILFPCIFSSTADAQTTLRGTITSLNGEPVSPVVITPRASGQSDLFDRTMSVHPDQKGRYEIEFQEPGVYTLEIKAVHHQTLSLPIMIFDQDQIDMDVRLVPRPVNDGTYFSEKLYREWIRACGNFNDYDFYTGIIFDINPDGSISAMLPADRDTIRYQIRGLTSGYVLPDEKHIHLRDDGTFEGIIIPPADTDSVELRYDPAKGTMYTRNLHKTSNLPSDHSKALLSFKDESDFMWIQPLSLINHTQLAYSLLNEDSYNSHDSVDSPPSNMDSLFTRTLSTIKEHRRKIETDLDTRELHPQQRVSLHCICWFVAPGRKMDVRTLG